LIVSNFTKCPRCDGAGETTSRGAGGYDYAEDCFLCERGRTTVERAGLFQRALMNDAEAIDELTAMRLGIPRGEPPANTA
jgi:hypothetical protein